MKGEINSNGPTPLPPADGSGWVGKLHHDRSQYSDWGWIRDDVGDLIILVKPPRMSDDEINRHRRDGSDPTQSRVDMILAAINGQNRRLS